LHKPYVGPQAAVSNRSKPASFAVDTVITVKWNFCWFVSREHESVLEVRQRVKPARYRNAPSGGGACPRCRPPTKDLHAIDGRM
jgi:hypothetical protein